MSFFLTLLVFCVSKGNISFEKYFFKQSNKIWNVFFQFNVRLRDLTEFLESQLRWNFLKSLFNLPKCQAFHKLLN